MPGPASANGLRISRRSPARWSAFAPHAGRKASVTEGLHLQQVAKALGTHPRTIKRWEIGETHPSADEWSQLARFFVGHVPSAAEQLARIAGVPSPIVAPVPADVRAIEDALVRAADRLDVAPKRVRAAVREILGDLTAARGTLADLLLAAQDKPESRPTAPDIGERSS